MDYAKLFKTNTWAWDVERTLYFHANNTVTVKMNVIIQIILQQSDEPSRRIQDNFAPTEEDSWAGREKWSYDVVVGVGDR